MGELSKRIHDFSNNCTGFDQYCVKAYAEALEIIPSTIALNSGMDFEDTIAKLYAAHAKKNNPNIGIDVQNKSICDVHDRQILDLLVTKKFAFRLSTNAALTILRIDHIIMSKPAGGSIKLEKTGHWDDD